MTRVQVCVGRFGAWPLTFMTTLPLLSPCQSTMTRGAVVVCVAWVGCRMRVQESVPGQHDQASTSFVRFGAWPSTCMTTLPLLSPCQSTMTRGAVVVCVERGGCHMRV